MASYMSLVASMGSIILGIFLVWHERTSGDNTAMEAVSNSCCVTGMFLTVVVSGILRIKTSRHKAWT
jgi:hypothetical protein